MQTASLFDEPPHPADGPEPEEPRGESPEARERRIKLMQEFSIEKCKAVETLAAHKIECYNSIKGKPWEVRRPGGPWEYMTDGEMLSLARRLI